MTLTYLPWLWVAAFVGIIITWDRNVLDWCELKLKHGWVWIQTQYLKYQLLREIRSIERNPDKYLDIAEQLLKDYEPDSNHR